MTIDSNKGEHLSSFVDGELDRENCDILISSICKDEDMKSCLTRYQMISDSMKNQLPDGIKSDFVHCVMTAIEQEPTAFAPTFAPTASTNSRKSSAANAKPGKVLIFPSLTKKVAGFAIAASVATIAVIGVQSQNQDPASQVVVMPENSEFVRMNKQSPMTANVNPVIVPETSSGYSTASSTVSQKAVPQLKPVRKFDPILQQYIVNHAQYASGSGVNDIFSHARIVASSQDKQSADQGKQ
jgi:negative regulator of sigma E activity